MCARYPCRVSQDVLVHCPATDKLVRHVSRREVTDQACENPRPHAWSMCAACLCSTSEFTTELPTYRAGLAPTWRKTQDAVNAVGASARSIGIRAKPSCRSIGPRVMKPSCHHTVSKHMLSTCTPNSDTACLSRIRRASTSGLPIPNTIWPEVFEIDRPSGCFHSTLPFFFSLLHQTRA